MMLSTRAAIPLVLLFTGGCASQPIPRSPDWIRQPSRTVDGGYLVFVGVGQDVTPEKAAFKAESQALQDLVNECSFAPKGTRIEDHYSQPSGRMIETYAKVGLAYTDCDAAKAANDPDSIRRLASAPLAEQLKKYQDLVYAPAEPDTASGSGEANPMLSSTTAPASIGDEDHYFIARQRVAYLKQTVILAPATVYVPASAETAAVTRQLSAQTSKVRVYEQSNPGVTTTHRAWSEVEKNTTAELPRSIPHPVRNAAAAPRRGGEGGRHAKGASLKSESKDPARAAAGPKGKKRKFRRHH